MNKELEERLSAIWDLIDKWGVNSNSFGIVKCAEVIPSSLKKT